MELMVFNAVPRKTTSRAAKSRNAQPDSDSTSRALGGRLGQLLALSLAFLGLLLLTACGGSRPELVAPSSSIDAAGAGEGVSSSTSAPAVVEADGTETTLAAPDTQSPQALTLLPVGALQLTTKLCSRTTRRTQLALTWPDSRSALNPVSS